MIQTRYLVAFVAAYLPASAIALTFSQSPLFIFGTEPRAMLVLSRDHQLSIKAYTDYSDLDNDGMLDTTYKDSIAYDGYFDSNKCYSYANNRFEPAGAVTDGTHRCDGTKWSGNFLNWASMTRMDVLRKTFYGGRRSTDTAGAGYQTVLERHFLPVDVHAFVKVYTPTGTMPTIAELTGISGQTSISLCNVSDTTSTTLTGKMDPLPAPLIKVAAGSWPQWDSSEVTQCALDNGGTTPKALLDTYTARVKVCDPRYVLEPNCKTYVHPTTGTQTVKPSGLLQRYGDVDADRRVRFGLITGSYGANKSGGVLRKNALFIANNNRTDITDASVCGNNNSNDEVDVCTGQFINQAADQAGIINVFNRLRIAGFKYTDTGKNAIHQYECNQPGIASFLNGKCVDWGNPLGEMYLETLRYFSNAGSTSAFDKSDASILSSVPNVTWSDPLPSTEWCALSNIIVLSTGLNSFDTDELASFTPSGGSPISAGALTTSVGTNENISGSYLIGSNGTSSDNQCTAKAVSDLASVKGICPEIPSLEGGYSIAGLAYAPRTIDLRPGYAPKRSVRWGTTNINKDWALRQPINTYAVQLAETLPSFTVDVGSGQVTLLPACQANSNASTTAWSSGSTGWRNCSMTNLVVNDNVDSASVGTDATAKTNTCSGDGTTSQCFTVAWEDSTWGNDYDMDGIQRLGYCVGSSCATFKMLCPSEASATATLGPWSDVDSNEMRIATCAIQAQAGHALSFGYTLTGTTNDGAFFPILRPGNKNFNVGAKLASGVTAPNSASVTQGNSTAQLLKNPLWYAAKYGGFVESAPTVGTPEPNLDSEWDAENNLTGAPNADGDPDNYFNIRNPGTLAAALSRVFDRASQPDAAASSVATNSTNLRVESRIFQARFSSADWSGQVLSYNLNNTGVLGAAPEWDAGQKINAQAPASRVILTKGASDGIAFAYANLQAAQQAHLNNNAANVTDGCGPERVDYLRGDATREGSNGTFACSSGTSTSKFRQRPKSKLGDVVNSSPWYVGAPSAGYSDVDHPGYGAFRTAQLNRNPVVYVGANDGMLHGFDASLTINEANPQGTATATAGQELVAYIPSMVFPNLSKLTAPTYNRNHRYLVDGSPMTGDADLGSGAANDWRTVLIGALGAGGKGYYALDVSDPGGFGEDSTSAANTLLWEFDETDMGFVFNMPPAFLETNQAKQIVKMANGKWAAILGNGYNSVSGKAILYVVFIEAGMDGTWAASDYKKIVADTPAGSDNGLSTPVPFDSNADGFADTVYAGDLKGNLWKFFVGPNGSDASVTSDPSTWKLALGGQPLFAAGGTQPIIWPPDVTLHPEGGQMVLFGTGKYIEPTDNTSDSSQTFYGVWDNNVVLGTRAEELLEQTVTQTTTMATTTGGNFRVTSANPINWRTSGTGAAANCSGTCTATHMGWYINLPTLRERATGIPKLINGVIYFNTLIPSTAPCDAGGTGWLMALDYASGGLVNPHRVFDTNSSSTIDASDLQVGGYQVGATLGGTTLIPRPTNTSTMNIGVGVSSLTSGALTTTQINFGSGASGRLSWREIVQ